MSLKNLKVGDVLRAPSGRLRIVRRLSQVRTDNPYVYFTIAHCSWTHRSYTLYTVNELARMGYRKVNHYKLRDKFDRLMEEEFETNNPPQITCCDVRGIP